MTDEESLLLVFVLFYLWQSCHWFRPGTVILRCRGDERTARFSADPGLESRLGTPRLFRLIPPFPLHLALSPWPFTISPDAILSFQERSWITEGRPRQTPRLLRFDEIEEIDAEGRRIRINGRFFVEAADPGTALDFVDLIGDLVDTPAATRGAKIEEAMRESLDEEAVNRIWSECHAAWRPLHLRVILLFAVALVVLPLVLLGFGSSGTWLLVLPPLIFVNVLTALAFRRAHRRLFPELRETRTEFLVTMLFFPPMTLRAHDHLSRFAFGHRHAYPVVRRLTSDGFERRFLAHLLRDLQHPITTLEEFPAGAEACVVFMRDLEWRLLTERLEENEVLSLLELDRPEGRHCPRCLQVLEHETCDHCRIATVA